MTETIRIPDDIQQQLDNYQRFGIPAEFDSYSRDLYVQAGKDSEITSLSVTEPVGRALLRSKALPSDVSVMLWNPTLQGQAARLIFLCGPPPAVDFTAGLLPVHTVCGSKVHVAFGGRLGLPTAGDDRRVWASGPGPRTKFPDLLQLIARAKKVDTRRSKRAEGGGDP
ncbi:hypothetical protein [Nocardia sp. NPDC050435]|uniref:hypothetical protein n=1 Tax=Nocardia sp. NPDC050435 TaxID=3155040 RepID=UPI0033EC552F